MRHCPTEHAVMRVLELEDYRALPKHEDGWVARRLGISRELAEAWELEWSPSAPACPGALADIAELEEDLSHNNSSNSSR